MMKNSVAIVKGVKPLTVLAKLSILDVCGGPGYASVVTLIQKSLQTMESSCSIRGVLRMPLSCCCQSSRFIQRDVKCLNVLKFRL